MNPPNAVPITILTGFLGAGKTTLLNRILNGTHGLRVAVLVNDFGAINIDAELVVGVKDDVISLANGCVCCTIRDDLVETVLEMINRPEAPEYIVLEASGVADPSGIAMTFVDSNVRERLRLDSVTCVIDADQAFAYPDYPAVMALKLRQVAFSDMVILNKVDLVAREQLKKVRAWIEGTFSRLRIVETNHCNVPLEILLSVGRFDPSQSSFDERQLQHDCSDADCRSERHYDDRDHSKTFSSWSYQTNLPMSLEALRERVPKLPGSVYRVKGILYTSEAPERPAVLQIVGRRVDITVQDCWRECKPRTRIVAIGSAGGIDASALDDTFSSCIAAESRSIPF